eukprot:CAMPEP_0201727806 /NCGR_PEP_ID=MMETSP0593-20130828/13740_1 /ASSEMBLY_ACC=CAM_ASM_000672 /TAXON_ID=267983 /ORGANISM="Skeletonema japonicum, Strain CCMP2506" /LENGTH=619 /DNA_ID=CAMNT_0048219735 /DNA_START=67 /DNA_END=1926 /DNA_ORIENTATION=+
MPIIVPKQKGGDPAAASLKQGDPAAAPPTDESKQQQVTTPVAKRYNTILRDFMAYQNQSTMYPEGHTFTEGELLEITPDHIIRYFTMKLYGDGDVIPSGKPIKGSHHTLDYYKKAISSFMPLKQQPWDQGAQTGNPTRAKAVNNFIRRICELEKDEVGSSKKRKSDETPIDLITSPNSSLLASSSTTKKARATDQPSTASNNSNAIISSILHKMQRQNSLTINFLGTLETSIHSYKSTLEANNQSITTELQMLNNSLKQPGTGNNISVPPTPVLPPLALAAASSPGVASPQPRLVAPAQEQSCWFYNHPDGSTRRVPPYWKFPSGTLLELYTLWHLGDPENCISPMKTFSTSDVSFCGKRSRMSLSEARCLANALDREVAKAGRTIDPSISQEELMQLFRLAVNGLDMPLATPTGRQRDIFRLKWSTFTKYKLISKGEEKNKKAEGMQLAHEKTPIDVEGKWVYEHADGSIRKVPSTWTFPMVGLQDMYVLWNCRNEKQQLLPLKTYTSKDVNFLPKGAKNLAEVRGLMNIISNEAARRGLEIKDVMTVPEALTAFSAGVDALNIPVLTPQGKTRNIARTKWSSASRYKQVPIATQAAKSAETATGESTETAESVGADY